MWLGLGRSGVWVVWGLLCRPCVIVMDALRTQRQNRSHRYLDLTFKVRV